MLVGLATPVHQHSWQHCAAADAGSHLCQLFCVQCHLQTLGELACWAGESKVMLLGKMMRWSFLATQGMTRVTCTARAASVQV